MITLAEKHALAESYRRKKRIWIKALAIMIPMAIAASVLAYYFRPVTCVRQEAEGVQEPPLDTAEMIRSWRWAAWSTDNKPPDSPQTVTIVYEKGDRRVVYTWHRMSYNLVNLLCCQGDTIGYRYAAMRGKK